MGQAMAEGGRVVQHRNQSSENHQPGDHSHADGAAAQPRGQLASPPRTASTVKNTPARKMQVVTARQPPTSDVGLSHELTGSP